MTGNEAEGSTPPQQVIDGEPSHIHLERPISEQPRAESIGKLKKLLSFIRNIGQPQGQAKTENLQPREIKVRYDKVPVDRETGKPAPSAQPLSEPSQS